MGVVNLGMQVAGFIAPLTIGFVIDAFDGSLNGAVWLLVSSFESFVLSLLWPQNWERKVS
ncbi:hypothetical protein ABG775_09875 [Peribacillus simplex]|uniref:hypothetical protein n=1 Tax=Peribacillus simplex TaxID=1478 RepID=UPI00339AC753